MANRIAGTFSLLAFAICLVAGLEADNPFVTTVTRGLAAMVVTLVIGMAIGTMAQRMLDDNIRAEEEKNKKKSAKTAGDDR